MWKKVNTTTNRKFFSSAYTDKIKFRNEEYSSLGILARKYGVDENDFRKRIGHGWSYEEALGLVFQRTSNEYLKLLPKNFNDLPEAFKAFYTTNPYSILGISALADLKEAKSVASKFANFDKLGMTSAYKSKFDFKDIVPPSRDPAVVENAIKQLDDINHRWLWFDDSYYSEICFQDIFAVLSNKQIDKMSYNDWLAMLFNCMVLDPLYKDFDKWSSFFETIDVILNFDEIKLYRFIAWHVTEDDRNKYDNRYLVNSFRETVINFFGFIISKQDFSQNTGLIYILQENRYSFSDELISRIGSIFVAELRKALRDINRNVQASIVNDEERVNYIAELFDDVPNKLKFFEIKYGVENVYKFINCLEKDWFYSDVILKDANEAMMNVAKYLLFRSDKERSREYFSVIYSYCNETQKQWIKSKCGIEFLKILDTELTIEDCVNVAKKYENVDPELYFKWSLKAAYKGDASSLNAVGVAYAKGYGVKKNEQSAMDFYLKAAELDEPYAIANLASRYYSGRLAGGKEKAKEYWLRSYLLEPRDSVKEKLDKNFAGWQNKEIQELENDDKFRNNIELLKMLSDNGVSYAKFLLGVHYLKGDLADLGFNYYLALAYLTETSIYGYRNSAHYLKELCNCEPKTDSISEEPEEKLIISSSDFKPIKITNDKIDLDFCGAELDTNYDCRLKFYAVNGLDVITNLWVTKVEVDGVSTNKDALIMQNLLPNESTWGYAHVGTIDLGTRHLIECQIEVDDENNRAIFELCSLSVFIDKSGKVKVSHSLINNNSPELEPDEPQNYGASCIYDSKNKRIELYFEEALNDDMLDLLKENKWKWHDENQCWYNSYNKANKAFVERLVNGE